MASTPAAAPLGELSEIQALAQKLFAQCKGRDAPSSYKLLATSVRNLRNGLEEVDEDYDNTRTLGPDDVRLLNEIGRSHDILRRVDLALQSNDGQGHDDVDMNAISDLKTGLDVAAHQLKLALDATTTGEIPLKLDTRDFPSLQRAAASAEDSSATWSRKSSMWSDGNKEGPRSPGASDATSVHNDRIDRTSEEKQLLSPSASSTSEARATSSFGSPFADPLSMGIEAATSFILGGDDDLAMSAYARPRSRSRAESNVSAATETFVSAPGSPELERKPPSFSIDSTAVAPTEDGVEDKSDQPAETSRHGQPAAGTETASEQLVTTQNTAEQGQHVPASVTEEPVLELTRPRSSDIAQERALVEHDTSTLSAAEQTQVPDDTSSVTVTSYPSSSRESLLVDKPLPSLPSPPETSQPVGDTGLSPLPSPAIPRDSTPEPTEPDGDDFARDLNQTMDAVFAGSREPGAVNQPITGQTANAMAPDDQAEEERDQPPPPERQPPPPPPAPFAKRSRPNVMLSSAKSKYRIVNASEDEVSDEELYSTSRATSPAQMASPTSVQSPPLVTPTITIDQSALDDEHREEESAAPQRRGSQSTSITPEEPQQLPRSTPESQPNTSPPAQSGSAGKLSGPPKPPPRRRTERKDSSPKPQSPSQSPSPASATPPQPPQSPPLPPSVRKRIEAAVKAGDKLLAKEIETQFQQVMRQPPQQSQKPQPQQQQQQPPPIPPRPKSRYNRPRAATSSSSSPAALTEKEIATEAGLEVTDRALAHKSGSPRLVSRVSVDHALEVAANRDPEAAPVPAATLDGNRHHRAASTSQLPPPQFQLDNSRAQAATAAHTARLSGWYAPGTDQTAHSELDNERIEHICHFWNSMSWNAAEQYLAGYLDSLIEQDNLQVARRVRHLLGVCATYQGEFALAITYFTTVLEIQQPADLSKPGNCEACYWLGDLYAMQNRRLEALLAYCAAQWGELFRDPEETRLHDLIKAEQEAVQSGMPRSEYLTRWTQEAQNGSGSILDPQILPAAVVKYLLEVEPRREPRIKFLDRPHELDPNKPRSSAFFSLSSSPQIAKFRRSKVSPDHFHPYAPWPLQYDPSFVMANVKRERILGQECDLMDFMQNNNGEAKLPKTAPMSIGKMDCFTCSDLSFLITAIRDCLKMLEMEWSEVANDQGAWFLVRHTTTDGPTKRNKMATVHYFAMSLFRQSFRSSYGVEVCSHGVSSARILDPANLEYERGVHHSEPKRIKKLITETLEATEKNRPRAKKRHSSIALGIGRSSSDDDPVKVLLDGSKPPPIPPRPSKPSSSGT